jgi:putative ABC transport system ATP-binding protein
MTLLKVEKIKKQYIHKDGIVDALNNINIEINNGDFITITGASGSGKTTLLLALAGLIRITHGQITFKDKRLDSASDKVLADFRNKHVGFVMQNFALIPYLTAIQNVMIPLSLSKISIKKQKTRAEAVLEIVGLENRQNHLPKELSAGQQQRIAIARALINRPSIILADEPTGNLDPALSIDILDSFKDISEKQGITILMVTHSPQAAEFGNRKIKLSDGKIVN